MSDGAPSICVMIAAYRAAATIGAAVASALAEPEVAEVIVVDDASGDDTAAAAWAAEDGSGRLQVVRQAQNGGPSAARNRAMDLSRADFLAVLDADDVILPGRFAHLLRLRPFDLAADNVVFFGDTAPRAAVRSMRVEQVDALQFVMGNLTRPGVERGELGFLKPIFSRVFLEAYGLRYDPALWLGEDYQLVLRMLLHGARFPVSHQPGYGALVRAGSLSGAHRTSDLWAQARAERALLAEFAPTGKLRRAMIARVRQVEAKAALRAALDARRAGGYGAALRYGIGHPGQVPAIVGGVARDKLGARGVPGRYLLSVE